MSAVTEFMAMKGTGIRDAISLHDGDDRLNPPYRAVDKAGNAGDFLLQARRDKAAARQYFEKPID